MRTNIALMAAMGIAASSVGFVGTKAPKGDGGNDRAPVEARGADLMAMIDAAGDDGLMLTQDEGMDLVNSGYAVVDTSVTDGNTAKVTLTDSGRAALNSSGNSSTSYEIEDNIEIPKGTTRRGRQGGYPFENLNVGQSFHVPAKDNEDPAKTAARLQSSVSGARARFAEETGETETATRKVYAKDEAGEFVKDEDGKRVVESEESYERPVTKNTRDFTVKPVGEDDPKGPGARVWRTA